MIYMARNTKNEKVYIGQTLNLTKRKAHHRKSMKSALYEAVQEHGFEAFEWTVLSEATDKNEMNRQEHEFIRQFKANDPKHGYNTNLPRFAVTQEEVDRAVAATFAALGEAFV
jgi:group I intron endonuclease